MGRYFNKGTRTVSLFLAGVAFFVTWMVFNLLDYEQALIWALLLGTLTALIASVAFPVHFALRDRRYKGIEQTLPQPVLFKANVSVRNENPPRDGYLFFTAGAMYLYTRDRKPYVSRELTKERIHSIRIKQDVYMTVMTTGSEKESETVIYSFVCGKCREAAEVLRSCGWKIDRD